jgi:signal transduction histidine kinase
MPGTKTLPRQQKRFAVDARTVLQLGRQSIKDHTTAILELVKNSYDADASIVDVEIFQNPTLPYIRIADNGTGMNADDVEGRWLRIGYSEKLNEKFTNKRRRKTGEKGVGRISADRLGAELVLRSQKKNSEPVELTVNWDHFDVDGRDLTSIPVGLGTPEELRLPVVKGQRARTGTELIIRSLRQRWTSVDLGALHNELAVLTPPFAQVADFSVILRTDLGHEFEGRVTSPFYGREEISLNAEFDGKTLSYDIVDHIDAKTSTKRGELTWQELIHLPENDKSGRAGPHIGPLSLRLLFFPRKAELLSGTSLRISDLREFLNRNAGVKIYRDSIRVRPYGDPESPEGDWLGLAERRSRDPAGVGRRSYRVAANQLVGAVFLSRDNNRALADSASREGLIHGDAFAELKSLVKGCLQLLEAHRHARYAEAEKKDPPKDPIRELKAAKDELSTLRADLRSVRKIVPASAARVVDRALDQANLVGRRFQAAQGAIEEALAESGVLRGLATLGIAASVFGHETQSAISGLLASTRLAKDLLSKATPAVEKALNELAKAIRHADHVAAWGAFALARVRRDKRRRRKISVTRTVESVIADLRPAFDMANIEVQLQLAPISSKTFEMDIEAILLNLLTNAYWACLQRRNRRIKIELQSAQRDGTRGFRLTVADSGPGIAAAVGDKIWQPLFTTRQDRQGKEVGTGLGLTIVRSTVEDLEGDITVSNHSRLGGASFAIWLPSK